MRGVLLSEFLREESSVDLLLRVGEGDTLSLVHLCDFVVRDDFEPVVVHSQPACQR